MRPSEWLVFNSMSARTRAHAILAVVGLGGLLWFPTTLAGQARVNDLVIAAGMAGEAWRGDFTAIAVPQIDSTEHAEAWIGEWSVNGIFTLLSRKHSRVEATLDAGLRQFATGGFQLRNYAPREHTGSLTTKLTHSIGGGRAGTFIGGATVRIRGITDHPPMPLYLSPGYEIYRLETGYHKSVRGMAADVTLAGEGADYTAPALLRNLDLLDRRSVTLEAGAGRRFYRTPRTPNLEDDEEEYSGFRLFGTYRYHSYPKQALEQVPRVDHATGLGGTYELRTTRLDLTVTIDGTRNRSNSGRVEYNRGRVDAKIELWECWRDFDLSLAATLARKRYIDPGQDALVPGEEADNESSLYATIMRSLGPRVNGAFRVGWQKVETNFNGAYYSRFGGAFFLRVRPAG